MQFSRRLWVNLRECYKVVGYPYFFAIINSILQSQYGFLVLQGHQVGPQIRLVKQQEGPAHDRPDKDKKPPTIACFEPGERLGLREFAKGEEEEVGHSPLGFDPPPQRNVHLGQISQKLHFYMFTLLHWYISTFLHQCNYVSFV